LFQGFFVGSISTNQNGRQNHLVCEMVLRHLFCKMATNNDILVPILGAKLEITTRTIYQYRLEITVAAGNAWDLTAGGVI